MEEYFKPVSKCIENTFDYGIVTQEREILVGRLKILKNINKKKKGKKRHILRKKKTNEMIYEHYSFIDYVQ